MSRRSLRTAFTSRIARLLAFSVLALVAFVARPSSGRAVVSRYDALPKTDEKLPESLWLPHCGMQIVEWRSTATFHAETSPSEDALAVIDSTCEHAFARYHDFLRSKKLPQLRDRALVMPAISLLPGNVLLDGKSARALNDLPSRFEAVAPGCCYWGLYVDSLNHLFIRNDPLIKNRDGELEANPRFVRTLTHEISHILSARLGVWEAVGYDRQHDEDLAEEFVAFMGIRYPAESSAEDLAYHRGTIPYAPATGVAAAHAPPAPHVTPAHVAAGPSANTSEQR